MCFTQFTGPFTMFQYHTPLLIGTAMGACADIIPFSLFDIYLKLEFTCASASKMTLTRFIAVTNDGSFIKLCKSFPHTSAVIPECGNIFVGEAQLKMVTISG